MSDLHKVISSICTESTDSHKQIEWLLKLDKNKVVELLNVIGKASEHEVSEILKNINTYSMQHQIKEKCYSDLMSYIKRLGRNRIALDVYCEIDLAQLDVSYIQSSEHSRRTHVACAFNFFVEDDLVTSVHVHCTWLCEPYDPGKMYDLLLIDAKEKLKDMLSLDEGLVKAVVTDDNFDHTVLTRNLVLLHFMRKSMGHSQRTFITNVMEQLISKIKKNISVGGVVPLPLINFLLDNAALWQEKVHVEASGIVVSFNAKNFIVISGSHTGYRRTSRADKLYKRYEFAKTLGI